MHFKFFFISTELLMKFEVLEKQLHLGENTITFIKRFVKLIEFSELLHLQFT